MNTLFIIYTFVTLVCFFQIIVRTCEATRQKRQIEELQDRCEYLSKQIKSLIKIADKSSEIDHLIKDRLDNVKDRFDNISDTLDLYKRLVDSLNDGQAKLNFRVQHLEMLNSNGGTLTYLEGNCPYTPNGLCGNPQHDCVGCPNHGTSGVVTTTSQQLPPEAIPFTKEE